MEPKPASLALRPAAWTSSGSRRIARPDRCREGHNGGVPPSRGCLSGFCHRESIYHSSSGRPRDLWQRGPLVPRREPAAPISQHRPRAAYEGMVRAPGKPRHQYPPGATDMGFAGARRRRKRAVSGTFLCRLPDSLPPFNALHSQDHLQRHGHVHGIAATRCPVQIRGDMLPRRSCPHVLGQMTEQRPGVAERLECHYSRPTGPCLRVSELWHFFGPTGSVQGSFSLWRNGFQESASRLALSKCPSSKSLPRHLKYSQRNDASGNSYTRSLGTHKSNFLAEINADLIAALRSCTLSGYPDDAFDPKRTWRRPICCAAHRPAHTDFAESQAL